MPREPPVTRATRSRRSVSGAGPRSGRGNSEPRNEPLTVLTSMSGRRGWSAMGCDPSRSLLDRARLVLDPQNLVPVIGPTGGADVVRHLARPALRAIHQRRCGQVRVRSAAPATGPAHLLLW